MPVYIAARDLKGFAIGTHQFIIIVNNSNPHPVAKLGNESVSLINLGNGKLGYVIGAHNQTNLSVEYFERSDYEATLEYFDPKRLRFYSSDFDTEVIEVKFPKINDKVSIKNILNLIDAFFINQSIDKIKYPTAGLGFNSNSWAQTVIELAGGKVKSDLNGFDVSNSKRIPKTYFMPFCPVNPRPIIN